MPLVHWWLLSPLLRAFSCWLKQCTCVFVFVIEELASSPAARCTSPLPTLDCAAYLSFEELAITEPGVLLHPVSFHPDKQCVQQRWTT